jgi:hypothetical protein
MFYIHLQCICWCKGGDIRPKAIQCFCSCAAAWWRFDRRTVISRHRNVSIQFNSILFIQSTLSHWICQIQFTTHKKILKTQFTSHIDTLKSQVTIQTYTLKTQNTSISTIKHNTLYNTALYQHYLKWIRMATDKAVLPLHSTIAQNNINSSTDATERILISF